MNQKKKKKLKKLLLYSAAMKKENVWETCMEKIVKSLVKEEILHSNLIISTILNMIYNFKIKYLTYNMYYDAQILQS